MRILVIGGTSFIGLYSVKKLNELGHDLLLFNRGNIKASDLGHVKKLQGDRENLANFKQDFKSFAPDVVLDMIPYYEEHGHQLLDVFSGIARRVVAVSSADVYRAYDRLRKADVGETDPTPLTEQSPLRDKLYPYRTEDTKEDERQYRYDKILMEKAVTSKPDMLPATIIRLPMVHGPKDSQHRFYDYIKRMLDKRPFILLPEEMSIWRGCRGYVENMAEAVTLCVINDDASNHIFHVAEQPAPTEREWVLRIANAVGWKGQVIELPNDKLPESLQMPYDFSQDWSLDTSLIREKLGYRESIPPEESMEKTVTWEQNNPPEEIDSERFDYAIEDAVVGA